MKVPGRVGHEALLLSNFLAYRRNQPPGKGCVHRSAVGRQNFLLVKLTTIGMSLVPMFFTNCIFFCRQSRVWEVLINDVTTTFTHGG